MSYSLGEVIVIGLAVWQAVEVWHHGLIFAGLRVRVELWQGWPEARWRTLRDLKGRRLSRPRACLARVRHESLAWLADLASCPWCTSVWVGLALSLAWPAAWWCRAAIAGLAASRLANALNDATHCWSRTPRNDRIQ